MGRLIDFVKARYRLYSGLKGRGLSWPPGELDFRLSINRREQTFLLEQARKYGPIFKQWMYGTHTTCVVGLKRGRKLLRDNHLKMSSVTIDQTALYPKGNLRVMQGEEHKNYRRRIIEAINLEDLIEKNDDLKSLVARKLCELTNQSSDKPVEADSLRLFLHDLMTDTMLLAVFGVEAGSERANDLKTSYRLLGSKAPVNRVGDDQKSAFSQITNVLKLIEHEATTATGSSTNSILGNLIKKDRVDETIRGNLVYMVETARFDVASLWRWALYYVTGHNQVADKLQEEIRAGDCFRDDSYLSAIISETLRMNQSEYVLRKVTDNVESEGYLIPANTRLRVCTWESMKDPDVFPDPFSFKPERFLTRQYSVDEYAPFGLDKHRCLGADFTIFVTRLFLYTLYSDYHVRGINIGKPIRGKHHWEPNEDFTIQLTRREKSQQAA